MIEICRKEHSEIRKRDAVARLLRKLHFRVIGCGRVAGGEGRESGMFMHRITSPRNPSLQGVIT